MKHYTFLFFIIHIFTIIGCAANLVVEDATIDFPGQAVSVTVRNTGLKDAGEHFTYVEINDVGAANAEKPQTQYSANISSIPAGSTWISGPIPFSSFSSPRGLDLSMLTTANLVVSADAKNMVEENNEGDNIYDAIQ